MISDENTKTLIADFNGLLDFIEKHKNDLLNMTGHCSNCHIKYKCIGEKRRRGINEIRALEPNESRFPVYKKIVDTFPFILHLVPQFIYDKWGRMETNLGCQYSSADIVLSIDKIERVYKHLGDVVSQKVYIYLLMYRLTLDPEYIYEAYTHEKQYFIKPFTCLGKDEKVVDCGGYTGDTLEEYLSVNSTPTIYYIYEPDNENYADLTLRISKLGAQSFTRIRPFGVFSKTGKLWFNSGIGPCCQISDCEQPGAIAINAVSLDEDVDTAVTFIKMDIEGSERNALAGAAKIMESYNPKLAICIYHSVSDLLEIPHMVIEEFTSYNNFAIRHHSPSTFAETVFYAWRA